MEKLLKIPYKVFNDWNQLQQFLEDKGNLSYYLVGDVDLSHREDIFDLGNLIRVDGHLDLHFSSIQSLGNLVRVDDSLDLENTSIKSLGNLEYIGGYLDLAETPIESLGNLQYVGEEFWLSRNHQIPEEQLTKFKGQIEYT